LLVAVELAALAVRGAARLHRGGKPDPLAATDPRLPLDYRATQRMLTEAMSRPEFALAFFRAVARSGDGTRIDHAMVEVLSGCHRSTRGSCAMSRRDRRVRVIVEQGSVVSASGRLRRA